MMALPSALATLYPIKPHQEVNTLLNVIVTFRSASGEYTLARDLRPLERSMLIDRKKHIMANMGSARHADIAEAVTEMMIGFDRRDTEDTAEMVVSQYATVLDGLPIWAVKRACHRWATGAVQPDEIKAKTINRAFAPSAANVRIVAEAIVQPFLQEATRISRVLDGRTEQAQSPEQRAKSAERIRTMADDTMKQLGAKSETELAAEARRREIFAKQQRDRTNAIIREEYDRQGVRPIENGGVLVSLPMLLSQGWTIQDTPFGKELLAPALMPEDPREGEGQSS